MNGEKIVIRANGKQERLDACTVFEFLKACGYRPTQVVVECNGKILNRGKLETVILRDGDELEVIVPVAGG